MVACKATVFLLPETSGDLATTANLECTHLMHAKLSLVTGARLVAIWLLAIWRLDRVDLIWGKSCVAGS